MAWHVCKHPAQYLAHSKRSINVYQTQGPIKLWKRMVAQSLTFASREIQTEILKL